MSVLERWLPFKFRRKSADEKKSESKAVAVQGRSRLEHEDWWPMTSLSQSMREWLDEPFFAESPWRSGDFQRWFGDFSPTRFLARVDVADEDKTLKVSVELPGMSKDDLEINVENGLLTIRGEKRNADEKEEKGVYRAERYYGYVHRSVPLPEDVDQENAEAHFDNGVLTVRFPKRARVQKGRQIAIKS